MTGHEVPSVLLYLAGLDPGSLLAASEVNLGKGPDCMSPLLAKGLGSTFLSPHCTLRATGRASCLFDGPEYKVLKDGCNLLLAPLTPSVLPTGLML